MTTLREAAQMALDALESSRVFVTSREKIKHPEGTEWYDERIEALRAALAADKPSADRLAQPEQEPVAWRHWLQVDGEQFPQLTLVPRTDKDEPLYTAPPQREWQGLTEDDFREYCKTLPPLWNTAISRTYAEQFFFVGAAKLREKNT